jgi:hypothetical protein
MSTDSAAAPIIADPLRTTIELPHTARLYPLGFPLIVESNSPSAIRAARESWAEFPRAFDEPPVRLSLGVQGESSELPAGPTFLRRQHLLSIVSDARNSIVCDLKQGFGFGWVTEKVASSGPFLRYHFLEAAALTMITDLYLTPVHGGLVERSGRGILLCGESFAGKSTLAYACARAGWTLISDDATFLVRQREDRYGIGNPFSLRFREDARRLFPELGAHLAGTRPNGKIGLEVATRDLPGIRTATGATIEHVVFLNRHAGGEARLKTLARSEALDRLQRIPHFGPDGIQVREDCRLLNHGVWQLDYGDWESAVDRLDTLAVRGN